MVAASVTPGPPSAARRHGGVRRGVRRDGALDGLAEGCRAGARTADGSRPGRRNGAGVVELGDHPGWLGADDGGRHLDDRPDVVRRIDDRYAAAGRDASAFRAGRPAATSVDVAK